MSESYANISRRVRVIERLQQDSWNRFDLAKDVKCHERTIGRDILWMQTHGVPIEKSQFHSDTPALWSIAKKWDRKAWLWNLMSEGDAK